MEEQTVPTSAGADRRKFIAGAGVAAAAATAGVLATSSPAGATTGVTDVEVDISDAVKWIDLSTLTLMSTSLTDGFAKATFSKYGDMVAMDMRIRLGTGGDLGSGPLCLDSSASSFAGYVPLNITNDTGNSLATGHWPGVGAIVNLETTIPSANQNQYKLTSSWQDLGGGPILVWAVDGRNQLFDGSILLGYGGAVPFGAAPKDGSVIYTTAHWQIS